MSRRFFLLPLAVAALLLAHAIVYAGIGGKTACRGKNAGKACCSRP